MRYTHVFFDLDGTLFDTGEGVKHAFQHALRELGRTPPDEAQLDFIMGPPLYWSFHDRCGLTEEATLRGIELFRAYYSKTGLWECRVFDGIPGLLERLKAAGVRLGVVTGKPEDFAEALLGHFGLRSSFDFVCGTSHTEHETSKLQLLQRAFAKAGLEGDARRGALMVGDRCYDIDGAREAGIDSLGVEYGFGTREELTEHGAVLLAATPADAGRLLGV